MEFCIGGDMCSMLCVVGYFDEHEALIYLAQVIFAVSYLHQRKIIHRDIKPENMLITAAGRLKLSDFGLSATHRRPEDEARLNNCASRMTPNQLKSVKEEIVYGRLMANTQTPALITKKTKERQSPIPFELSTIDGDEEEELEVSKRTREMLSSDSVKLPDSKRQKTEHTGLTMNLDSVQVTTTDDDEAESVEEVRGKIEHNFTTPIKSTPNSKRRKSLCNTPRRTPRRSSRGQSLLTRESLIKANILGSPDYMPPELLKQSSICMLSDVWSVGICYFELLTGIPPFNDCTPDAVFENIKKGEIDWPIDEDTDECLLTGHSQQLIRILLQQNPYDRPSIDDVIKQAPFDSIMQITNIEQVY